MNLQKKTPTSCLAACGSLFVGIWFSRLEEGGGGEGFNELDEGALLNVGDEVLPLSFGQLDGVARVFGGSGEVGIGVKGE